MRCAGDLFKERLMQRQKGACLICGEPLVYLKQAEMMKCSFCGKEEPSYAKCGAGHYVCDACHARQGIESIMRYCAAAAGRDPIAMLTDMMNDPYIHMHGPEHHTMVGAALMTAYRNAGGDIDLTACLAEMKKRGARCPLRRGGERRHVHEHYNRHNAAERQNMGPGKHHNRTRVGSDRPHRRAALLQAGQLYRGY